MGKDGSMGSLDEVCQFLFGLTCDVDSALWFEDEFALLLETVEF